jgi:hypothetical protein
MTKVATTTKAIRLALALTALTPVPLFAEGLTARQMLAQAQSQAVTLHGETKKPANTELAKADLKADISKADPIKTEPVSAADLAPPLPVIAPPAPVKPVPTTSADSVSQSRVASESVSTTPVHDAAPPSIATITVLPAPTLEVTSPAPPAPVAVKAPAATSAPENQTRATQAVPIVDVAPAQTPATSTAHGIPKPSSKTSSKAQREKLAAQHSRGSRAEQSFDGGGSIINARMISRIMQRPEVKSLIAQYGLE